MKQFEAVPQQMTETKFSQLGSGNESNVTSIEQSQQSEENLSTKNQTQMETLTSESNTFEQAMHLHSVEKQLIQKDKELQSPGSSVKELNSTTPLHANNHQAAATTYSVFSNSVSVGSTQDKQQHDVTSTPLRSTFCLKPPQLFATPVKKAIENIQMSASKSQNPVSKLLEGAGYVTSPVLNSSLRGHLQQNQIDSNGEFILHTMPTEQQLATLTNSSTFNNQQSNENDQPFLGRYDTLVVSQKKKKTNSKPIVTPARRSARINPVSGMRLDSVLSDELEKLELEPNPFIYEVAPYLKVTLERIKNKK